MLWVFSPYAPSPWKPWSGPILLHLGILDLVLYMLLHFGNRDWAPCSFTSEALLYIIHLWRLVGFSAY
jgi:hypothetical protein